MQIENKKADQVLVVIPVEKRIDASSAVDFKGKMIDWINEGNYRIALDLSHVDFIDSSGLGAIVSSLKALGNQGDLVICCVHEMVMSLFKLTRMDRVFKIYSTQEEAIKALAA